MRSRDRINHLLGSDDDPKIVGLRQVRTSFLATIAACLCVASFLRQRVQPEGRVVTISFRCAPVTGTAHPFPYANFGRSFRPVQRHRRRAFHPLTDVGPYRLPKALQHRLTASLAAFRNAETSFVLATFLGRFWSAPGRLDRSFPVDRRALTNHVELGLTEAQVRGAVATLERVGFLDRPIIEKQSPYRATEDGLRRKPILFVFGSAFRPLFKAAHQPKSIDRRVRDRSASESIITKSPKNRIFPERELIMGDVRKLPRTENPINPENPLEKALARLRGNVLGG